MGKKIKIVGFSAVMLGVAGWYQMFFGNAVYRAGQLQAEALGGMKTFNKFWTKHDIQERDVRKHIGSPVNINAHSATWEWGMQMAINDAIPLKTRKQIEQNWFTTSFGTDPAVPSNVGDPTYHDP